MAEYNQAAGKSWKYEYDSGGNITKKTEYSNATASGDGTVIAYEYTDSQWGDLLTKYNGKTIDYDKSGNMAVVFDSLAYVWQGGRQLQKITDFFTTTISFEYNAAGLRTSKNDNGKVYNYTYQGSLLASDVTSSDALYFHYDANGSILGFTYVSGSTTAEYYYIKNLQGDVIGILDASGNQVASYTYNAWGQILSVGGSNTTLANRNPIRYRGYYYDSESGLYYLQSRYYNPEIGRFISADGYVSTARKTLAYNLFVYCYNNPVYYSDSCGDIPYPGFIHNKVVNRIANEYNLNSEQYILYEVGFGRADLVSNDGQVWDVKPNKKRHINAGVNQIKKYVANSWKDHLDVELRVGSYLEGDSFSFTDSGLKYTVTYSYAGKGVIAYDYSVKTQNGTAEVVGGAAAGAITAAIIAKIVSSIGKGVLVFAAIP